MKVGEKYVIEIDKTLVAREAEPLVTHTLLAKIKGFNSLVFDENGLSKLEKLEDVIKEECDRAREEGFNAGRYAIEKQGVEVHDGCDGCEYELCDGEKPPCIKCKASYRDLYKPKSNEIKVGDEVEFEIRSDGKEFSGKGIVLGMPEHMVDTLSVLLEDEYSVYCVPTMFSVKTGRHFPQIAEALEQIKGEQ